LLDGFHNNLIFFGAQNGDVFIFDLNTFKFLNFTITYKQIKHYLSETKILKNIPQTDSLISIRLDQTDYSRLFLVYPCIGMIIFNIEKQVIDECCSPFINININNYISGFDLNENSTKLLFSTSDGCLVIFKYQEKDKKFHLTQNLKSIINE
jgi:hypothetical protein